MEETRKYKQTELGLLPEDWEVVKLGEKVSSPCYGIGAEAISFNGVDKYLRITDISDEGHFAPNPLCSPAFFNEIHIAKENDLFVARTGASVGKTYLYNSKDGRLIFAGFLMKLNITDANSKFVFYYSQTNQYKNWVISESMRSGQPGLNLKQTMKLSIPLPPIEEQRRIASALTSIDNLIDSLDRLIAKKRAIKQGVMQQLLSGKKRLKGFTEPWVENKLGEILSLKNGFTFKSETYCTIGKYKIITIANVQNGRFDLTDYNSVTDIPASIQQHQKLSIGDILISMTGNVGRVCRVDSSNCLLNQRVGLLEIRPNVNSDFVFNALNTNAFENAMRDKGQGAAQANISKSDIEDYVLLMPSSLPEQQAIASILTSMDNELSALEAKSKKYEQIKRGMMQQLLTGRIRLN